LQLNDVPVLAVKLLIYQTILTCLLEICIEGICLTIMTMFLTAGVAVIASIQANAE
jgi:hypothetical protein